MKIPVLLGLACAIVLAPATASGARFASFEGSCDLTGTVTFSPPMTDTAQPITQRATAVGQCSDGTTVRYSATSFGDSVSCGSGLASGSGVLRFPDRRIRFALSETRLAAFPTLHLTGRSSGSADAAVYPAASQDPVAALQACAGAGLGTFAFEAHMQTTPSISG